MIILDRYIEEVGKHLPRKNRSDIQKEIRSTIEDMLEDRAAQNGRPLDDSLVQEVLKEYGAPSKVAASYLPVRYLIGPRMYPFFTLVLRIVFSVLFVIALVRLGIALFKDTLSWTTFLKIIGQNTMNFLTGILSAFGNIVLIFAILERTMPASQYEMEEEKWDPKELNSVSDPDKVNRVELIFEVLFTVLGLILFNFYPDFPKFEWVSGDKWVICPGFSEAFFQYLPWINILFLLQIVIDLVLIREGIWKTVTRILYCIIESGFIALACVMLVGPSLIDLDMQHFQSIFGEASETIIAFFDRLPHFVLIILIIVQSIDVVKMIWKALNRSKTV